MADQGEIVVIGAGVAGLGSALAFARAGHRVTLLERDATPLPTDPDAAFEWDRRGAPQVRHSHALLARLRNLLRDRHPDVLEALLAAGATEMRFAESLPAEIVDREPRPGDEDLVALACRRTTFEWVLRRVVLATDAVTLRDGVVVEGLEVAADGNGGPPVIAGVRVHDASAQGAADRGATLIPAAMVVAAVGRRSAVPAWLREAGVELDETVEDTGVLYLSRFYRLRDGVVSPDTSGPIGGDLGYLKYAVFQGDNRTLSVTFCLPTEDRDLRGLLIDPDRFDAAARELPTTAPWVEPGTTQAITDVHTMGGLINRRVRYLDGGEPVALGFHAVGDAHTCTNPLYGRGCSLAMVQATLLADAAAAHPGSEADAARARALAYEAACEREIEPWYRAAVAQDAMGRAAQAEPPVTAPPSIDRGAHPDRRDASLDQQEENAAQARDFIRDLMRDGLMPAVRTDATVFRAFVRAFNLLDPPDVLTTDPEVVTRVLAVYQTRDERPPEEPLGPDRAGLLAALTVSPRRRPA
jgi:2-polyprenyl-6-methoxyphenol hydroxylase-like FAD-dependent oxidoreductase